jgi:hypothetical protein
MRLPRVRLRLWWIMAVIAAVGLTLGVYVEIPRLRSLSQVYQGRAQAHADLERAAIRQKNTENENLGFWAELAAERRKKVETGAPRPDSDESWEDAANRSKEQAAWHAKEVVTFDKRADYHGSMRRKWLRAAGYPWLSVASDSAPP